MIEVLSLGNSKFIAIYIHTYIYTEVCVCKYAREKECAHLAIGKQRGCRFNLSE